MSKSFEQLLDAYAMASRQHQEYSGQIIAAQFKEQCRQLREQLIAMFNASAQQASEPFDLERARKGEAITYEGQEVQFVGVMSSGNIVVELNNPGSPLVVAPDQLRMAPPKMRTVYANIYAPSDTHPIGYIYATQEHAVLHASIGKALSIAVPMSIAE